MVGAFNAFTFKVIIDKYDPIAIYFIVLGLSFYTLYVFLSRQDPLAFVGELVWQPTPVFLPRESQGLRGLVGCRLWGRTESDTTETT